MDEPTPSSSSSRAKTSPKRFSSSENREEIEEKEQKPEKFDDPYSKIGFEEGEKEEESVENVVESKKARKSVRIRHNFSIEERHRVFQYILDQCRSKTPGREGRVAKFKVQTQNGWVWEKFKEKYGYQRDVAVYRIHYDYYAKKLHKVPGLTLDERVDLYYAMEIPITDEKEKQSIIEKYGVTVDETTNIITGSTVCQHWDLEHSASENELEDGEGEEGEIHHQSYLREQTRYVEYHDGVMWQFIVDLANRTPEYVYYGCDTWDQFKQKQRSMLVQKKSTISLATRFRKILLPNLHIMPFDIETKAALYETLDYPVPKEFREELISSTGVQISPHGYIQEFPERPAHLVLQSQPPTKPSKFGIKSASRLSILREPDELQVAIEDRRRPWTIQEDREMWEHIRHLATGRNGVLGKLIIPVAAQSHFWWKFAEETEMNRGCAAMARNFKRLRATVLTSEYDLKTKLELYYIVAQPLEEEAIEQFKTIAILVLDEKCTIRYAIGDGWLLGRSTDLEKKNLEMFMFQYNDEQYQKILKLEDEEMRPNSNTPSTSSASPGPDITTVIQQTMAHIQRFEAEEKIAFDNITNSEKFPYVDKYHRSKLFQMRQRREIRSGAYQPLEKRLKLAEDDEKAQDLEEIEQKEQEEGDEIEQEIKLEQVEEGAELSGWLDGRPPFLGSQQSEQLIEDTVVQPFPALEKGFDELEKNLSIFYQKVQEGSRYLEDQRRKTYRQTVETLTHSFRLRGKNALTDNAIPKRKWWEKN